MNEQPHSCFLGLTVGIAACVVALSAAGAVPSVDAATGASGNVLAGQPPVACSLAAAQPIPVGSLFTIPQSTCSALYGTVRLSIGDQVTVRASAGDYTVSAGFERRGLTDDDLAAMDPGDFRWSDDGTDCLLNVNAYRAGQVRCRIASTGTYYLRVYGNDSTNFGKIGVWVSHSAKHLVQGTCNISAKPPLVPRGVTELGDIGEACWNAPQNSPYSTYERWRFRVRRREMLLLKAFRPTPSSQLAGDYSYSDSEIQVIKPHTDPVDYLHPGHREICSVILISDAAGYVGDKANMRCSFPRPGDYLVIMSQPGSGPPSTVAFTLS